jgi:hypothetical protein
VQVLLLLFFKEKKRTFDLLSVPLIPRTCMPVGRAGLCVGTFLEFIPMNIGTKESTKDLFKNLFSACLHLPNLSAFD